MPADWNPGTQWAQAFGIGSQSAIEGFNTGLRMQELRSQAAMRRLQEEHLAKQIEALTMAHDQAIQKQADSAKAATRFNILTSDTLPLIIPNNEGMSPMLGADGQPMPRTEGMSPMIGADGMQGVPHDSIQIPNPNKMSREDAYLETFGRVLGQYNPEKLPEMLADIGRSRQASQTFSPTAGAVKTPSGRTIEYINTSRNSAQPVYSPEITNLTNPLTGETTPVIQQGNNIKNMPVDVGARQAEQKILAKALDLDASKVTVTTDPSGKRVVTIDPEAWAQVAGKGAVTTANRTALEAAEISASNLIAQGRKLLPLINESTVGAKGELKRLASRSGVTLLFPGLDDPKVAEADAVGRGFTAGVIRGLRSDTNINKDEVAALERSSNTINWTNVKPAKARLAVFLEKANDIGRQTYIRLKQPIPPEYRTLDEIIALKLPDAEAGALYNQTYESLIEQVREEAGL